MATASVPACEPLAADVTTDVCIVGAGIAGLSAAHALSSEGASVVVLDDGPIGHGETARTTAHLSNVLDTRYAELERLHGADRTRLIAESHADAIARIESTVRREAIACDFERVDGYLFLGEGAEAQALEVEHAAALRAGVDVAWADRAPLPAFDTGRCLRFPRQAQIHPLRYLAGLAKAFRRNGGHVYEAHAGGVFGGPGARVETASGHTVHARAVVVATNTPVNDRVTMHTKQASYRTYVIAAEVPAGSVPTALYWDTADPYHYVRLQTEEAEHDLLIVGGEDHHTGQGGETAARFERLERWAARHFPTLGRVRHRWSGQIVAAIDGLAFIGRNPGDAENVFIATGDSGNGMTHGTIAGTILSDLVAGRPNPWASLYDPSRFTARSIPTFAKETLHVAGGYARWLGLGRLSSVEELEPGCGAVFQRGLRKIAAYRDEQGALHERSAVCPHLGGVVVWNETERSWDCPCHGSRFDACGRVQNGPANSDLDPV